MTEDEPLRVPIENGGDLTHAMVSAGAGMIPVAGSVAQELFRWFVKAPIEKRREEWMGQVGKRLDILSKRGITLETLQNDPAFVDVFVQTYAVAMNSQQEEKRQALLNAITNSAMPGSPEEAKRQMFIRAVDSFTFWHLRLIKLFANPAAWFTENQIAKPQYPTSLDHIAVAAFPKLDGEAQREFRNQIWKELSDWGMLNTPALAGSMNTGATWAKRTTPHGDAFLAFITEEEA